MTTGELHVLGAFDLTDAEGHSVASTPAAQRLLGYLAIRERLTSRSSIACSLWPEASRSFGAMRLRSTLARLAPEARALVDVRDSGLQLDPTCVVDYRQARTSAEHVLGPAGLAGALTDDDTRAVITQLELDLLPDSYDNWALEQAEDWRLMRAEALEALAAALSLNDRPHLAMQAVLAAIRNEPLRETAHATLCGLHIRAGNHGEAVRALERYCRALAVAYSVSPSPRFRALIDTLHTTPPEL